MNIEILTLLNMASTDSETNEETEEKQLKCGFIDLHMIPCKVMYIFWGGVNATIAPFLNPFFVNIGLTTSQAGFITGFRTIAALLANPLWGFLADYSGRRRLVAFVLCFGSLISLFPIPWLVHVIKGHSIVNTTCVNETLLTENITCQSHDNTLLFYVLVTILATGAIFVVPLPGFMDTIAMAVVKTRNSSATYGEQRIFGSIGFCLFHYLAALAADHYNVAGMSQYTAVYFFFAANVILVFPAAFFLIGQAKFNSAISNDTSKSDHRATMKKQAIRMITNPDNIIFFMTVFVSGLAMSIYIYFTLLLVKDIIPEAPKSKRSLILVVGSSSSMIMYPFSSKVIKLLRGPTQGIIVALSTYFVRYMIMSYTRDYSVMLVVNASHGLCYALAWSSMMEHLHTIVTPEIKLTTFMLLSAIHFGVCGLVANIAGGKLYDLYGGPVLFRGAAIMCGVCAVLMLIHRTMKYFRTESVSTEVDENNERDSKGSSNDVEMSGSAVGVANAALEVDENSADDSNEKRSP